MEKIKKWIDHSVTGKIVLLLFVLTNVVYAIMLIVTIPKTMAYAKGLKLLDMMPMGYDAAYINTLFETLGDKGRHVYLTDQLPVDMIYPFLFGLCYSLGMAYVLKKLDKLNSPFFYLCFLPVIAAIADYAENMGIMSMLLSYPNLSQWVMDATNSFTLVKSMMTTVYFLALIFALLLLGMKAFKERRNTSANKI